ncbi:glutamine amidotransferase-related protein [Mucilaginibacter rivuli]|uniref:glutamine amidotransferase-related protein n=1 Tax=Mucilaginibacter rivuli TaxID=2857527 RepID=UPI0021035666|nr:GMP synthase [Mucilaginibacter rivuli]
MREIKAAIIDLYDDYPNQAISSFQHILKTFGDANGINIKADVFDLRGKNEAPGLDFDVYLSSGGPGSPIDSEGSEWETKYWKLVDDIDAHNQSEASNKKHVFFVCHSFQLLCRRYKLGDVNQRTSESYGIMSTIKTEAGKADDVFNGLADNYYIFDSREWQVVNPDMQRFKEIGATLLTIERERTNPTNPRALMAIRFNPYFIATQYHPEVDPVDMKERMLTDDYKNHMIEEYGIEKYNEILGNLNQPDKLLLTYNTIIPRFLAAAIG